MLSVYDLEPGVVYRVVREFVDYHQNRFVAGELLTFDTRHFLPYHGGHTLVFEERPMYLQEEINADLVNNLSSVLAVHDRSGLRPPQLPPAASPPTAGISSTRWILIVALLTAGALTLILIFR